MYCYDCFNCGITKNQVNSSHTQYFLKSFTAILFALLIILSSHREALIYLSFKLNQTYIAKNLCIQKNEQVNSCCGKCVLKKQLAESQKKENEGENPISTKELMPLIFVCSQFRNSIINPEIALDQKFKISVAICSRLLTLGIFHPPRI